MCLLLLQHGYRYTKTPTQVEQAQQRPRATHEKSADAMLVRIQEPYRCKGRAKSTVTAWVCWEVRRYEVLRLIRSPNLIRSNLNGICPLESVDALLHSTHATTEYIGLIRCLLQLGTGIMMEHEAQMLRLDI